MSDLVERLRDPALVKAGMSLHREAADEIERLHKEYDCILDDMDDLRESLRLHDKAAELSTAEIERLRHEIDVQCSSEYVERILKENERLRELTENDGKEIGSYREGTGLRGENARLRAELSTLAKGNVERWERECAYAAEIERLKAMIVDYEYIGELEREVQRLRAALERKDEAP